MARKQQSEPLPPLEPVPAPAHLSERAAALWASVVPSRGTSPGRLAMVQTALEALDRAEVARVAIEKEGMVSKTEATGALHVHPLVKVERESRGQFIMAWKALNLECDRVLDTQRYGIESEAARRLRNMIG